MCQQALTLKAHGDSATPLGIGVREQPQRIEREQRRDTRRDMDGARLATLAVD
jgi:hypothetical protein